MFPIYVFSLVLGGGFLGLSLLGDIFGGQGDVDLSGDMGGLDADLDAGLDADLDAGMDADVDADTHGAHGGDSHVAAKIFSIRTITYSLFGFGAVGTLMTTLGPGASPIATAAFAVGTGLVSGALITTLFGWVQRGESGALPAEANYAGHLGRVTLPIAGSGGRILVEIAGREVELKALPHASVDRADEASHWRRVLVIEMDRGVALVTPAENDADLMS
jgi:hypothetical protein